ncbi:MAG: hypothetical protein NTZ16_01700 [Verrucomicrobia bacterium]|nr:hypothetical protein [Verrucomicrobiota bacterium]
MSAEAAATIFVIGIFVVAFIVAIPIVYFLSPPKNLQLKLVSLGDLRGKSLLEIKNALGKPDFAETAFDGSLVVVWIDGNYQAALVFKSNAQQGALKSSATIAADFYQTYYCEGISEQVSNIRPASGGGVGIGIGIPINID